MVGDLDEAVVRTVTVLVIACPHALGLAIPLVIALSTAVSARAGILVKDRLALERMRTVDAVLFDKTGTLTKGAHTVTGVATGRVERRAAGSPRVEADSEHPLARAIVRAAGERGPRPRDRFRSLTGRGVQATIDGTEYAVGGPALLRELDVAGGLAARPTWESAAPPCCTWCGCGTTRLLGALALEDEVRPEARAAIAELRGHGMRKIAMITGDARAVAEAVAADLGFRPASTRCSPRCCRPTRTARSPTCRRAAYRWRWSVTASTTRRRWPAPTSASRSAPAPTSRSSRPAWCWRPPTRAGSPAVIRLSRASYRKMVQNLAWAAGYNVVAIPLAAGVFAWAGLTLSPAIGAVLMSASTIVVALNAQLLRRVKLTPDPAAFE